MDEEREYYNKDEVKALLNQLRAELIDEFERRKREEEENK